jgi:hypothetical protein
LGKKEFSMQRDMDFIRELLLEIEKGRLDFSVLADTMGRPDLEKLSEHMRLLKTSGYLDVQAESKTGAIMLGGLSWKGGRLR